MEKHYFYALLLCFFSGITLCQLIVYFIVIVLKYNKYQFQRVFATTLLMLAVGFLDNFIMLWGTWDRILMSNVMPSAIGIELSGSILASIICSEALQLLPTFTLYHGMKQLEVI